MEGAHGKVHVDAETLAEILGHYATMRREFTLRIGIG